MRSGKWLWGIALLPLAGVTLVAQEQKDEDRPAQAADQPPAPANRDQPEASSAQQPAAPDDQVSADNNLSFPVDI